MNYDRFINPLSASRQLSALGALSVISSKSGPDMVDLSPGCPNPETFPFESFTIKTKNGTTIKLEGEAMEQAIQYLPTIGFSELTNQLRTLVHTLHAPPPSTWSQTDLYVTNGAMDGVTRAFEMVMEVGASVVIEEYVYPGVLTALNPYRARYVTVEGDGGGMRPDRLREAMAKCRQNKENLPMPKFMYINPTGGNPTGTVLSLERRREIYKICSEYDLLILEDDPYYFLQFDTPSSSSRVPGFLSLDVDGRVLRFDSFSKVLSPGMRLGIAIGPKPLIQRMFLHMRTSSIHPSSLSQVVLNEVLKAWGQEGFLKHVDEVVEFYRRKRDVMNAAAERHLKGLCRWDVPAGGMFLWLEATGVPDTWNMIMDKAIKENILVTPGRAFSTRQQEGPEERPSSFIRVSFSMVREEVMDGACQKLARLIREEERERKK